jgi:hypothetical protein
MGNFFISVVSTSGSWARHFCVNKTKALRCSLSTFIYLLSRLSLAGEQSQCPPVPPSSHNQKIKTVRKGIRCDDTSTIYTLPDAIKLTWNMYNTVYKDRFTVHEIIIIQHKYHT